MTQTDENTCSLCSRALIRDFEIIETKNHGDYYQAVCVECGRYNISGTLKQEIENGTKSSLDLRILARYARLAFQENNTPFDLNEYNADIILENNHLPSPKTQLDQLLTIIARQAPEIGDHWQLDAKGNLILLGLRDDRAFVYLVGELKKSGLIEIIGAKYCITLEGWQYVELLSKGQFSSKRVFMAMDFKDEDFRRLVDEKFRPAVEDLGLKLFVMYDETKLGVIDNLMRLEIRNARAMICDLSHANRGANWEGGYAEGLGRPVIYTCEKKVFDNQHPDYEKPHFDTNHLQTIPWTYSTIDDDMRKLKASLRLAIPESIQQD